jgi:8-oxo-dGTP pyrophosphatase MutT (NUDIX family)
MERIIINEENLKDNQIDKINIKVRALLVLKKQLLICNYGGVVMLPGGKTDKGETNLQGLIRELHEETGILYSENELNELFLLEYFQPNYPTRENTVLNRLSKTYFYYGTFRGIDNGNKQMTEKEKKDNFSLELVDIEEISKHLCDKSNPRSGFFDREITEAVKVYKKLLK